MSSQPDPLVDVTHGISQDEKTLFDQLKAQREEIVQARETLIPVPGYKQFELLAQYRVLDGPELEQISRKVAVQKGGGKGLWSKNLNAALDVMISACTGLFVQLEGEEEPRPLTYGGDAITGYSDHRLAEVFGFEGVDTARKAVLAVFGNRDIAISQHSVRLQRWFSDATSEAEAALLGEML